MQQFDSLVGPARDRAARGDLHVHDHVCAIYDRHEDQFEPACQFIQLGLERNEQCIYIAEHWTPVEFKGMLDARGVKVAAATAAGALQVVSGKEMRLKLGGFSPESMLRFLTQSERMALQGGFSAFRLAADMAWLRRDNISAETMFLYESELNSLLADRQIVGLCQYARDDFNSELLIAAAETHPLLAYNTLVCDNFYYVPPEEYLKPAAADVKLTRYLYNVVTRERLMHYLLAKELPLKRT